MTQRNGFVVWFTGLSGAGKSTLTGLLAPELRRRGLSVEVLDGDAGLPPPGPSALPTVVTVCADDLGVPTGPDDDEARRRALRRLLGLTGRSRAVVAPGGGPPLVLLDDAFARFDAHTTWDLLDLLARLGSQARVQVLYLTEDPVVVGWARPLADLGRLALTTSLGTVVDP